MRADKQWEAGLGSRRNDPLGIPATLAAKY
jgi:hypothetical protein